MASPFTALTEEQYIDAKFRLFDMLDYEIYHPEVERFHRSTAKIKVATAARRTTKSYSAAHDMLLDCLLPDKRLWIVGPNYSLAEKEFRYIHQELVIKRDRIGLPKPKVCQTNARAGQLIIQWDWGTYLEGKSAERPEGLLGEAVDKVLYSESGQLPRVIREKYVEPTLLTKRGSELIATTPEEGAEWVHELFLHGYEKKYPWVESFTWDGKANPTYDWEHYNKMKEYYGDDSPIFREQYMGEWVFYGGRVYPMFDPDTHVIDPFEIPSHWPRIRGIDFGHRDPFVCLWAAVGPQGELYFYREYHSVTGDPTRIHSQHIKGYEKDEPVSYSVADPQAAQLEAFHALRDYFDPSKT